MLSQPLDSPPVMYPTRVFVGGLPRETSELELETFFSNHGSVADVRIVCDRRTGLNKGYGFVTFETQESPSILIEKGTIDFKGRKLRLRQAVRKKGCGQYAGENDTEGQWVLAPVATDCYSYTPQVVYSSSSNNYNNNKYCYNGNYYYYNKNYNNYSGENIIYYPVQPAAKPVCVYPAYGTTYYIPR